MTVQICSCEGLDPKCKKCFGSGYMNTQFPEKTIKAAPKKESAKQESFLPDTIESLSRKEIENFVPKIIDTLDLKSKKQMQILHVIPFKTTTFRRDFKAKFGGELLEHGRYLKIHHSFLYNTGKKAVEFIKSRK